jgi:hypothetical protein
LACAGELGVRRATSPRISASVAWRALTGDFADKFDISPGEAIDLIERFGNDLETLELEVRKLKK